MKLMLDVNILPDVFQKRDPHYQWSALVVKEALKHVVQALLPAHGITTIHYVLEKYADRSLADQEIDWLLSCFEVPDCGRSLFIQARKLPIADFEDAVVAALAQANGCAYIITRNEDDFANSPIQALHPKNFVEQYILTP